MWYSGKEGDELDYGKPIAAIKDGTKYLLLPHCEHESYHVLGFDWFNLETGEFNSCVNWVTAAEAVEFYRDSGTIIKNIVLPI